VAGTVSEVLPNQRTDIFSMAMHDTRVAVQRQHPASVLQSPRKLDVTP
jgi:hypothetical protein